MSAQRLGTTAQASGQLDDATPTTGDSEHLAAVLRIDDAHLSGCPRGVGSGEPRSVSGRASSVARRPAASGSSSQLPIQSTTTSRSSSVARTEQRLSRMIAAVRAKHAAAGSRAGASVNRDDSDSFHDHAGDLIQKLASWSGDLDRRGTQLDCRERQLNQQLRLLRQVLTQLSP